MDKKVKVQNILRSIKPRKAPPSPISPETSFRLFLEYQSLRDIGHHFNAAHMSVAYHIRKHYGRYATNDVVLSVYRTLIRDYLPYKTGTSHQQALYQTLWEWVYPNAIAASKDFEMTHKHRYVKDSTRKLKRYQSVKGDNLISMYQTIDPEDYRMNSTKIKDGSRLEVKGTNWWRIDFVVYLTSFAVQLIREEIDRCLEEKQSQSLKS